MSPPRKCSGCGAVVPQSAIDDKRAYVDGKLVYCEECALLIRDPGTIGGDEESFPEPDSAEPTDATVELSVERLQKKLDKRRKEKHGQKSAEGEGSGSAVKMVVVGAIVVAAIILAVLFFRR
ncbi:MAG: hypothetical protein JW909_08350 [Planctomycetes bacterium]|nr:hypothetical protein [Planctomycetota bacterium]